MTKDTITLIIGQGDLNQDAFAKLAHDYPMIALDGAGNKLVEAGYQPQAVIGDLDSLTPETTMRLAGDVVQIDEQDSNDFEKALYHFKPPLVIGFGLFGKRFDQTIANLHVMAKYHPQSRIIAVTNDEIISTHKGSVRLAAEKEGLLAILPLAPMRFAASQGLAYALDGLACGIGEMVSSSNYATADEITITPQAASQDAAFAVCRPLSMMSRARCETLF